jgi:hypothetical protein
MPNARYFAMLQTHVLLPSAPAGELASDRAAVYEALGDGRCYLSFEALAPGRGFRFWAEGDAGAAPMGTQVEPGRWTMRAVTPRPARLRLLRDGAPVQEAEGHRLEHRIDQDGAYRVEARLADDERGRLWLVSNPVYVRAA